MRKRHDWAAVQQYFDERHDAAACRNRFDITYGAWATAIRRGKLRIAPGPLRDLRRQYDWAIVQAYYDEGHSFYECMKRFGFCGGAWHKARNRGEITARPSGRRPLHDLLRNGKSRRNIKLRLLRAGLLENQCEECGLREWLGERLIIQLDHINGVRDDHRLENLRMLCPNCHSQTETYGWKNRNRALQDQAHVV